MYNFVYLVLKSWIQYSKKQNMFCFLAVTSKTGSKLPFSLAVTPDELSNCTHRGKEVFTIPVTK